MRLFRSLFKSQPPPLRSVLFVCTANITRSPSAEAIFRKLTRDKGDNWLVGSAGTKAHNNSPANPIITLILKNRNMDISQHRARRIKRKLLNKYQWIVVMQDSHRELILNKFPELGERVILLRELVAPKGETTVSKSEYDMPDPTGKDPDDYLELFEILDHTIPKLVQYLSNLTSNLEFPTED